MNEDFYKEILEENKEAVKQKVTEAMFASIENKFKWELPEAVSKEVNSFIKEEIAPAVRESLLEDKDAIIKTATEAVSLIPAEVAKALQEHLAKTLTDSYKLRGVTKALFDY